MPKVKACALRDHQWQPLKRGSNREQCRTCGDVFPCRYECSHIDCRLAMNEPLPEWVTLVPAEETS